VDIERPVRPPSRVWRAFARRWHGHRFLKLDPLYALPERFVRCLHAEAADLVLLGENRDRLRDDLDFEYDLSQTVDVGFFRQRPLGNELFTNSRTGRTVETADEEIVFEEERDAPDSPRRLPMTPGRWSWAAGEADRPPRGWRHRRVHEYVGEGVAEREAEEHVDRDWADRKPMDQQADRYHGWLVQQDEFWRDLMLVKVECGSEVNARQGMPVLNPESLVYRPDDLEYDEYHTPDGPEKEMHWVRWLCRKWCLAGVLTWELVLPRRPQLATGTFLPLGVDQGLTVSIPYPFLAGRKLDVHELVRRHRDEHTPPHLRGWVRVGERGAAKSTKGSFDTLFKLYRLVVLCLRRRYAEELAGKTVGLDQLLANYLTDPVVTAKARVRGPGVSVDQTRRRRFSLETKLRSAAPDIFHWV